MNKKELSSKAYEALRIIRNDIMHFGKVPSVRRLMTGLGYKSPRSAMEMLEKLEEAGFLKRKDSGLYSLISYDDQDLGRTVLIPLLGSASCGLPLFAEENIEAMIPVSTLIAKTGSKYFLLHATGDSMNNAGINDGDLMLVRQQETADQGQRVVALIDDSATVKEFYRKGDLVILKPNSKNKIHQNIILTSEFKIQGVVITTIPRD